MRQARCWLSAAVLAAAASVCDVCAEEYSGPAAWRLVNTNAAQSWLAEQARGASVKAWPGVVADSAAREVRLLAEAVGHREGITAEFFLVGPQSDRAYESFAVTVASPGDIARAMESLGVARGGCIGSRAFRFWALGERVSATVRPLGQSEAKPLQACLRDANAEAPLLGSGELVFTGGRWSAAGCATDTNLPCSVISLYNAPDTLFDLPSQVAQSEVYGRLTIAQTLPYGTLLEVVVKPLSPAGEPPRVLSLAVAARMAGSDVVASVKLPDGGVVSDGSLSEVLAWLRAKADSGRELFVTLEMDDAMPLKRAVDVARVFVMLDGKGVKLDGKAPGGVFPKAFLPQEKWRERPGRTPQPFEVHLAVGPGGTLSKKLVFVEEDWSVQGLDPKLTPREFPFEAWEELPGLINKVGGEDSRVPLLFVYAPADQAVGTFMAGVRLLAERLPLVYVFAE